MAFALHAMVVYRMCQNEKSRSRGIVSSYSGGGERGLWTIHSNVFIFNNLFQLFHPRNPGRNQATQLGGLTELLVSHSGIANIRVSFWKSIQNEPKNVFNDFLVCHKTFLMAQSLDLLKYDKVNNWTMNKWTFAHEEIPPFPLLFSLVQVLKPRAFLAAIFCIFWNHF